MVSQEQRLCESCGKPAPPGLPFCGFCGHANDPNGAAVAAGPPPPDRLQAPNGQELNPSLDRDAGVWGELVGGPPFTQSPAPPAAPAAAPPLAPPAVEPPATEFPAGPAPGQPSHPNRSRTPLLLAIVGVVLVAAVVITLVVSGGSGKSGNGSEKAASPGSTPPAAASGPSRPAVVAGTTADPWVAQAVPSDGSPYLFNISCSSTKDCWAVGKINAKAYCRQSSCPGNAVIIATKDGGQTWQFQYPTVAGLESSGYLYDVSCGSPTACQASGAAGPMAIISTDDGGSTWVSETYPSQLADGHIFQVYCKTANNCWALGSQSDAPFLLATTDGGRNWTEQHYPSNLGISTNGLFFISCATTSHCVMVADAGGTLVILATDNGGSSWSMQPYPSSITAKTNGVGYISCPTERACYITGFTTSVSGGTPVILATHDGGSTWVQQSYPSSLGLTALNMVQCADGSHCWAVGEGSSGSSMILATSDGGATWEAQTIPSNLGLRTDGLIALNCQSLSACWVLGNAATAPVVLSSTK